MYRLLIPFLKPLGRLFLGLLAIPIFRFVMRRLLRVQEIDEELEKDLEQWFKASLVLLAATANMEDTLFGWILPTQDVGQILATTQNSWWEAWLVGMRLLLVIGVIEAMPDQALFSVIHPGPPKLYFDRKKGLLCCAKEQWFPYCKGFLCQHISRSSPVFAILSAILHDGAGWFCYVMAIVQYLIIGLVTSRDRALDVLSEFDKQIEMRRQEIIKEFDVKDKRKEEKKRKKSPTPEPHLPDDVGLPFPLAEGTACTAQVAPAGDAAKRVV
ncbi:DNA topoisomerase I [Lacunimicrobium album]